MNKEEPKVLTRMRLSECWGDNLNVDELKEVNNYIDNLQSQLEIANKKLEEIKECFNKSEMFQLEELLEIDECLKIKKIIGGE